MNITDSILVACLLSLIVLEVIIVLNLIVRVIYNIGKIPLQKGDIVYSEWHGYGKVKYIDYWSSQIYFETLSGKTAICYLCDVHKVNKSQKHKYFLHLSGNFIH